MSSNLICVICENHFFLYLILAVIQTCRWRRQFVLSKTSLFPWLVQGNSTSTIQTGSGARLKLLGMCQLLNGLKGCVLGVVEGYLKKNYNICIWISDEIDKSEVNLHEFNCTVYIFITKFVVSLRFFTSLWEMIQLYFVILGLPYMPTDIIWLSTRTGTRRDWLGAVNSNLRS